MKLTHLIKQLLEEQKKKADRCKRIADRKYDKPSAYKSGAIVRCRQGKIWKDLKEYEDLTTKNSYIDTDGNLDSDHIQNDLIKIKPYYKSLLPNYLNDEPLTDDQIDQLIELFTDNEADIFDSGWMTDADKLKFNQRWQKADINDLSDWFVSFVEGLADNWGEYPLNEEKAKDTIKKFIVYPDFQGVDPANILGQNKVINVKDALGNEPNKNYNYFTTEKKDYVDEMIQNAQNDGWKSFPPIIAIPHPLLSGKYVIIDGNHRLGAFKIGKIPQIKATILSYDDILLAVPGTKWQEGKTPKTIALKDAKSKGIDLKKYFTTKDLQLKETDDPQSGKAAPYGSGYARLKKIIQEIIQEDESLHKWFKRKGTPGKEGGWVDCNTCRNGKCKPCGRKKGEKRAKYPSCRPTPAQCKTKGKGKKWGKTK